MLRIYYRLGTSSCTIICHHSYGMYFLRALFHSQILFVSKILSKNKVSTSNRRIGAANKLLGLLHSFVKCSCGHWTWLGSVFNVSLLRQRAWQLWRYHLLAKSIEEIVLIVSSGWLENLLVSWNSWGASLLMLIGGVEVLDLWHYLIWV